MLTDQEITEIVSQITYKPGWTIHVGTDQKGVYCQVGVEEWTEAALDAQHRDGTRQAWKGGKRYFSPYMCRQEVVGLVYGLLEAAEKHEMKEWFRYRGASIYNPHLDPDALVALAKKGSSFNVRENAMTLEEPDLVQPVAQEPYPDVRLTAERLMSAAGNLYRVVLTCGAHPEQYTVKDKKSSIMGYLRLRHGHFVARYVLPNGDWEEPCYEAATEGIGGFEDHERGEHLTKAIAALNERHTRV